MALSAPSLLEFRSLSLEEINLVNLPSLLTLLPETPIHPQFISQLIRYGIDIPKEITARVIRHKDIDSLASLLAYEKVDLIQNAGALAELLISELHSEIALIYLKHPIIERRMNGYYWSFKCPTTQWTPAAAWIYYKLGYWKVTFDNSSYQLGISSELARYLLTFLRSEDEIFYDLISRNFPQLLALKLAIRLGDSTILRLLRKRFPEFTKSDDKFNYKIFTESNYSLKALLYAHKLGLVHELSSADVTKALVTNYYPSPKTFLYRFRSFMISGLLPSPEFWKKLKSVCSTWITDRYMEEARFIVVFFKLLLEHCQLFGIERITALTPPPPLLSPPLPFIPSPFLLSRPFPLFSFLVSSPPIIAVFFHSVIDGCFPSR